MSNQVKNHMPLVQLSQSGKSPGGGHVHCDYCIADAVWYHWADQHVARDCYACDVHVSLLNPFYGVSL